MAHFLNYAMASVISATLALHAGPGLIKAAANGDVAAMQLALKAGEKLNDVDSRGWTPLMWAVYYEQLSATEWLLEKGADPNIQSTHPYKAFIKGSTALIISGLQSQIVQVRSLVKYKAKVDLKDDKGLSVVDHARKLDHRAILQVLGIKTTLDPILDEVVVAVEAGKTINDGDRNGWTPLMWAVYYQDLVTTKLFLEKGADPNVQATGAFESMQRGATPLIIAGYYGLEEIARVLVDNKARVDFTDVKGKTAESYANDGGYTTLMNALTDRSPLETRYQKVVIEGITLDPKIPMDYLFLGDEFQITLLEALTGKDAFPYVELVSPGKTYDASTLLVRTELRTVQSDIVQMAVKASFVHAATGKLLREQLLASSNSDSMLWWIPFATRKIIDHSAVEDLGAVLARHILIITGKIKVDRGSSSSENSNSREEPRFYLGQGFKPGLIVNPRTKELPHDFQAEGFRLGLLKNHRTAVWPLGNASLGLDIAKTVYKEYGSRSQFLSAFSEKLSKLIGLDSKAGVINPKAVQTIFSEGDSRRWLNPKLILNDINSDQTSLMSTPDPTFEPWSQQTSLNGVRYVVVPLYITLGRDVTKSSGGGWVSTGAPGGAGMMTTGGGGGATTCSSLRLVVLDLELKKKVWDGTFEASASSVLMKATALHENENELIKKVELAIQGF